MSQKLLQVPYHPQQDQPTCGAACLKMAVEALGGRSDTEDNLFKETHSEAWFGGSSPENIAKSLKERGGPKASGVVVAATIGNGAEDALIRRMVWSIRDADVPPIALVAISAQSFHGDGHFVVVAGYHANRHPTGPADAGLTVSALEMNNPFQASPDQKYPMHVTYKTWRRRYMKPTSEIGGFNGHVVAVVAGGGAA